MRSWCRIVRELRRFTLGVVVLVVASVAEPARGEPDAGEAQRESYSVGHQIGMDLARQGRKVDLDALLRGAREGLAGREPSVPAEELETLLLELKRGIVQGQRSERLRGTSSIRRAGEEFLLQNAQRADVVTLPSGLQYRIIRPGTGSRPGAHDSVVLRYRSTRLDGAAFHDSTTPESQPETLRVGQLIAGVREAIQLMPAGARWEIFLPPRLAFGRRGPLADQTVIYDLQLIEVRSAAADGQREGE